MRKLALNSDKLPIIYFRLLRIKNNTFLILSFSIFENIQILFQVSLSRHFCWAIQCPMIKHSRWYLNYRPIVPVKFPFWIPSQKFSFLITECQISSSSLWHLLTSPRYTVHYHTVLYGPFNSSFGCAQGRPMKSYFRMLWPSLCMWSIEHWQHLVTAFWLLSGHSL